MYRSKATTYNICTSIYYTSTYILYTSLNTIKTAPVRANAEHAMTLIVFSRLINPSGFVASTFHFKSRDWWIHRSALIHMFSKNETIEWYYSVVDCIGYTRSKWLGSLEVLCKYVVRTIKWPEFNDICSPLTLFLYPITLHVRSVPMGIPFNLLHHTNTTCTQHCAVQYRTICLCTHSFYWKYYVNVIYLLFVGCRYRLSVFTIVHKTNITLSS